MSKVEECIKYNVKKDGKMVSVVCLGPGHVYILHRVIE